MGPQRDTISCTSVGDFARDFTETRSRAPQLRTLQRFHRDTISCISVEDAARHFTETLSGVPQLRTLQETSSRYDLEHHSWRLCKRLHRYTISCTSVEDSERIKPRNHPSAGQNSETISKKKRSIMKHSSGLPQDAKSLRSCTGNRAKVLLKGHLGIKCHSK